jgi:hypothetical protein
MQSYNIKTVTLSQPYPPPGTHYCFVVSDSFSPELGIMFSTYGRTQEGMFGLADELLDLASENSISATFINYAKRDSGPNLNRLFVFGEIEKLAQAWLRQYADKIEINGEPISVGATQLPLVDTDFFARRSSHLREQFNKAEALVNGRELRVIREEKIYVSRLRFVGHDHSLRNHSL